MNYFGVLFGPLFHDSDDQIWKKILIFTKNKAILAIKANMVTELYWPYHAGKYQIQPWYTSRNDLYEIPYK